MCVFVREMVTNGLIDTSPNGHYNMGQQVELVLKTNSNHSQVLTTARSVCGWFWNTHVLLAVRSVGYLWFGKPPPGYAIHTTAPVGSCTRTTKWFLPLHQQPSSSAHSRVHSTAGGITRWLTPPDRLRLSGDPMFSHQTF